MERTFFTPYSIKRFFSHYGLLILTVSISFHFYSCGGSEEPIVEVDRVKDSTLVYTGLEKAFSHYKTALKHNESTQDAEAKRSFEDALKTLKGIDTRLLTAPGNFGWKKDYDELATSVVQDYLTTQTNIPEGSIVFKFAQDLAVSFEKIKEMEQTDDLEPLPDGSDVPLVRNSVVDEFIQFWTNTDRGRAFIDKTLYRSGKYFPIMRKILRYHNAPEELIYLSVQESGLNSTIVSRSGAVGLWQFMPATGSAYQLYQDGYRDDRRDFEKSTDAAARHLKDLYRTYGDWYLSFAAYNAGPGRVNSAIRKSGSRDFWDIRAYLPNETRDYVPYILALSFVFRDPEQYGFKDIEYGKPLTFDRVNIDEPISFEQVAQLSGTDIETIRELNPELMNDQVPDYEEPYHLRIPYNSYNTFAENIRKAGLKVPEFAGNEKFNYGQVAATRFKVNGYVPYDVRKIGSAVETYKVSHVVKDKEQLNTIAFSYSVRATDIRLWNGISYGKFPVKDQKLNIYLAEDVYKIKYGVKDGSNNDRYAVNDNNILKGNTSITPINKKEEVRTTSTEQNNTSVVKNTNINPIKTSTPENTTTTTKTVKTTNNTPTGKQQVYTVKEGDYLSTIAGMYGVLVKDIQEWNGLENDVIRSGQKLKIYSDKKLTPVHNTKTSKTVHVVAEGENLTMIANEYGVELEDLMNWNNLDDDVIKVGQKLTITAPSKNNKNSTTKNTKNKVYTVQKGDMLSEIAAENGLTVKQLMEWNNLDDDNIQAGQKLKLYDDNSGNKKKTNTKTTTKNTRERKRKQQ
jgi:membrane-bound lytic murein transglycosylase D